MLGTVGVKCWAVVKPQFSFCDEAKTLWALDTGQRRTNNSQHRGIITVHRSPSPFVPRGIELFCSCDCLIWHPQTHVRQESKDSLSSARQLDAADAPPPLWYAGTFGYVQTTLVSTLSSTIYHNICTRMPCASADHFEPTYAGVRFHPPPPCLPQTPEPAARQHVSYTNSHTCGPFTQRIA